MTTRIDSNGPVPQVVTLPTAARTTTTPTRPFRQFVAASASAVIQGAQQAVSRLPGGPLLASAVRSTPAAPSVVGQTPEGGTSALGTTGVPLAPGGGALGIGATGQQSGTGVEGVLAQGVDQNMYFLELQERISQESRSYSALSNVLKARHETMKNAIGNIR